jgi:ribosomal protein L29
MTKSEIESKLAELKGKQASVFKMKKENRNTEELSAIRKEMNDLKTQAKAMYRA